MRYILTGKYANGDEYGEATESLGEVAYIIGTITKFDNDRTKPEQRVLEASVTIETEEE